MKKIILMLALLAPTAALSGEYDGVYHCVINLGSYGTREAYLTFQTKPDNSALSISAAPVDNHNQSYGYALGSISGNVFTGRSASLQSSTVTFSGNPASFTDTDTYTLNGQKVPATTTCTKIW